MVFSQLVQFKHLKPGETFRREFDGPEYVKVDGYVRFFTPNGQQINAVGPGENHAFVQDDVFVIVPMHR